MASNSDMREGSVSVRLNPFKTEGVHLPILDGAEKVPWSPFGYILSERPTFTLHPLFHAGCYYVQDSSAMFVGHLFRRLLAPSREALSLPDGVSTLGHVRGGTTSEAKWWDEREARTGPAGSRASREGKAFPDGVSTLGHVRGGTTLRVLDLCAAPGGKTTDLAASLRLQYGDEFELVSNEVMKSRVSVLADNVAIWGDPCVRVISADPAVIGRSMPGYFDVIVADVPCSGEGMFRKDPSAEAQWSPELVDTCAARQKRILADVWPALKEGGFLVYSTCTYEDAENDSNLEWAASELGGEIVEPEDEFAGYGVRKTRVGNILEVGKVPGEGQWAGAMKKTSRAPGGKISMPYTVWSAPQKGEMKGGKFVPNPDWALSIGYDHSLPEVAVDKQTALHFLHKDAICLPAGSPLGFTAVSYKGVPLGFVNNLGNRSNNLHPKQRRILMDVTI